eukprot:scaffold4.g4705.t1
MTVDYLARKQSKKAAKKAERLKPKRERKKKNQPRRLCRGPCFQQPGLTAEDLEGEGRRASRALPARAFGGAAPASGGAAGGGGSGELAAFSHLLGGLGAAGGRRGAVAAVAPKGEQQRQQGQQGEEEQRQRGEQRQQGGPARKRKRQAGAVAGAAAAAPAQPASPEPKRPKLSTAVKLLRPQQQAAGAAPAAAAAAAAAAGGGGAPAGASLEGLPPLIQACMVAEGFAEPTPVQAAAWPVLLAGRDLEAVAEPGSGKTLAYLLPAAARLAARGHGAGTRPAGPLALVLVPTRELAQQVAAAAGGRGLRRAGLRAAAAHGGSAGAAAQAAALAAAAPHLLVATPGRLLDLASSGLLRLDLVRCIVLDEADKMLSLGFQPQIEALRRLLLAPPAGSGGERRGGAAGDGAAAGAAAGEGGGPERRRRGEEGERRWRRPQVALLSATMPGELAAVAAAWLRRPERLRLAAGAASISRTVTQVVQVCAEHKKLSKLRKHLDQIVAASAGQRNPPRILIFANRVKTVRFLHSELAAAGWRAALLHGERSQAEREEAIAAFRSGKAQVLVASDVAARGLHIRGLPYVVNYDFPPSLETYVHRRAVDPNLVKLAAAFRIAAAKLGWSGTDGAGSAGGAGTEAEAKAEAKAEAVAEAEAGEERPSGRPEPEGGGGGARAPTAAPRKEDVLRELGLKSAAQKKAERRRAAKRGRAAAGGGAGGGSGSEGEGEGEESGAPAPAGRRPLRQGPPAAGGEGAGAGGEGAARPAFVPARRWGGAIDGYAFKKGPQGQGYYLDDWQLTQQPKGKVRGGGGGSGGRGAAQKEELRQLKAKYSHKPIGGSEAGARAAAGAPAGGGKRPKPAAAAAAGGAPPPPSAAKLLPGRLRELRKRGGSAAAIGGLLDAAGFGSSEEEEEGGPAAAGVDGAGGRRKPKALPGRLRKKLAKQKQQRAAGE